MNRRNRAFTLIELTIVISIILVLMGMVILGVRKINESSRHSTTKVVLEQCRSMITEYGRSQGQPIPSEPLDLSSNPPGSPAALAAYWPGDLNQEIASDSGLADPHGRYGTAVRLTSALMGRMMQLPSIRANIQALPADRLLVIPQTVTRPAPANATYVNGAHYAVELSYGNSAQTLNTPYMCVAQHTSVTGTTDPGNGTFSPAYWLDLSLSAQAVLLDGWNNPVLFFPSGGFVTGKSGNGVWVLSVGSFPMNQPDPYWTGGRSYQADRDYVAFWNAAPPQHFDIYKCVRSHSTTESPATANSPYWMRVPTVPFFASAGPDGVFFDPNRPQTLDDNVYSFEN